ncbi:meiotic recombination protein REC8 homolog isoform X1 [Thunnus maccoyii]|uniref:meiotic recombination protein REC8 homolog isoform X1 n=2 Tax=Thunnus maccoyii TaxID=8240 RepID=UPI001C4D23B2|nr:meiotic recombination protein REC8 homolog isoform X1 [Thunnus maccoyii]
MFYYPAVLKRHTGCFSTIWLVATKGIRVPRRDFLKVNVKSTCDDIMNYVLEQVPPPAPGLPRPRFSLYLSSQLQYGVIVVYHRQCAILLEELQSIIGQLLKQRTSQKIDIDDHSRQALLFPDALCLLEEAEGAPDPLFGVMSMQGAMPSPTTLIQMGQEYLREASAELSEPTAPTAAAAAAAAAALESGITASPDSITLRETEQVAIPAAEFEGVELADHHPDTIDFLLAQTDHFPEGDLETAREEVTRAEQETEREGREGEPTGSTIELQPTALSSEEAILLPQEEPGSSVEKPGLPTDQLTPVSMPALPSPPSVAKERVKRSLELEDVPPPEVKVRRQRRKKQLIFFDPETQLSQEVLQQQIDNPLTETTRPLFPLPSSHRRLPAAELLSNPCTFLPEEVQFLWRQAATVTPLSGLDLQVGERGPESTDSEKEREREMVEMAEMAEREERHELSPKEVPRDFAESEMFGISGHDSLILEGSDQREGSREISPIYTSEREGSTVSRSTLQDIPEVMEDMQGRMLAESPGLMPVLAEHEVAPVLFQSLLPPDADRRAVSNIFHKLLEILSARKVRVEQDMPYGDILILPGPNDEEVHLT